MRFSDSEQKIIKRKMVFDRSMIIMRVLTFVGVALIVVAGPFY